MNKLSAEDIAAVAKVITIIRANPPAAEAWDAAERHGPKLEARLRNWLKEKL